MDQKQKILFCGDAEGKFNALFNRVATINKKSGPFDCLFCVGNFFGINNKEFIPYKQGEKKVPVLTYILGPNNSDHISLYPSSEETPICENLYYLGKRGVFTNSKGLRIAYISGMCSENSSDWEYSSKDIMDLYSACVGGKSSFRGIDILLASQWPEEITNFDSKKISLSINKTSKLLAWLIMKLKPRYIVSGLEGIYYERSPFRCPNLSDHDSPMEIVSRFIGLARVGNANKDKWIYALNLTPLDQMKISDLLQKTTDETDCPYNFDQLEVQIFNKKRKSAGSSQYFYDTTTPVESENKNQKKKRQKIEYDQSKCWFCLASPSVEKHLIITVGESTYLALAKGGLVEEHLLICPIEHYQHSLRQPDEVQKEIEKFKNALRDFFAKDNQNVVFFERNYKTSHMQLQVIPVPKKIRDLDKIFLDEAEAQGLKLEVLDRNNRLDQVVQSDTPFFIVELPGDVKLYTRIKGHFPLNFGRDVLASSSVLNLPNREDWRECTLSKEEEEHVVKRIRNAFQPFDFTDDD